MHEKSVYNETDHTKTTGERTGDFFADIQTFFPRVGTPSNFLVGVENGDHADSSGWSKNIYLATSV